MSAFLQPSLSLGVVCTIYGLDSLGDGPAKRSNTPPLRTVVLLAVPADPTPSLIALLTRRSRLRSGLCGNQTSRPSIPSSPPPQLRHSTPPPFHPAALPAPPHAPCTGPTAGFPTSHSSSNLIASCICGVSGSSAMGHRTFGMRATSTSSVSSLPRRIHPARSPLRRSMTNTPHQGCA